MGRVSGITVNYYHTDAVGSTRLVTSATKTIQFSDNYRATGQDNGTPTGSDTYKFTGKPYSTATGLYYEYQRWYDPSTGRFISQDPPGSVINPQSLNQYAYVANTPTSLVDPSGRAECYFLNILREVRGTPRQCLRESLTWDRRDHDSPANHRGTGTTRHNNRVPDHTRPVHNRTEQQCHSERRPKTRWSPFCRAWEDWRRRNFGKAQSDGGQC